MQTNLPLKNFARHSQTLIALSPLTKFQTDSFRLFLEKGIKEVFQEIFPIRDYSDKEIELEFVDCYFEEPKLSEEKSREKELNYEVTLRVKLRLNNKKTGLSKEQEVYFGEIPLMTPRGTFIINGVERVVISQIIRSPGVYFQAIDYKQKKLFGASLFPYYGSWLELDTDPRGLISVKIDRKRKVAITALLRIFGLEDNQKIKDTFQDVDTGEIKYIETTLEKDNACNLEESYIEVYKRLRPGELPTFDNARDLIKAMFFRADRYNLAKVGRFKLNQRLGLNIPLEQKTLTLEDLIAVTKEIIRLNNNPQAKEDDIDHLANRRIRAVGEILSEKTRVALTRMRRIIQDRMASYDFDILTPALLINPRQLITIFKEFFNTSQVSQFMDQVNPLSELEHKRRISSVGPGGLVRERAGLEVRDVHSSHYGRICPIQTPEGQNIGLILSLTNYARLNELGFIEAPYVKVKNGCLTNEVVWLDAFEEEKYKIVNRGLAMDDKGRIREEIINARFNGELIKINKEEVELMDVSCQQIISPAVSLIPFLEHDDTNRALMGGNMQKQAVPCIKPEVPLVGTGIERRIALDSGQCLISDDEGVVIDVDSRRIVLETNKERKVYPLVVFQESNKRTCLMHRPVVKNGQVIKKGDLLADGASTTNGELALGQNLLVAFMPWYGSNYEDAVVISEKVLKEDRFTSVHLENFSCDVIETKLGPETITADIPNVSEEKLRNLDEEGIIRIGAEVKAKDILVGKVSPKGEVELSSEERLLQAIFGEVTKDVKDSSLYLEYGRRGRVIRHNILSREDGDKLNIGVLKRITVEIAQLRKLRVGDKLAGRHGNKGVIAKIVPEEDMPYLEDGTPVDIILNSLGIASRMNLGQVFETHLGWAAQRLGYRAISPALDGATVEDIKTELIKAGLPEDGKVTLYDGKTGEPFSQKVAVGIIYMMKLDHMVEDKVHMRSTGPYSLITQQPLGGKAQFGGQRFGEMEVWALEGYGASHTLQEMLTIKSDDVLGRAATYEAIIKGERIKSPNIPAAFNVILREFQALGLKPDLLGLTEESLVTDDDSQK